MNQFCTVLGINFFAVLQPEVSQKENKSEQEKSIIELMDEYLWDYKQDYTPVYHRFLEKSEQILQEQQVPFVNINNEQKFTKNSQTLFIDTVHTNDEGNKVVAEILADYLSRMNMQNGSQE